MRVGRDEASEIAEDARRLAKLLYDYEASRPKSAREQGDNDSYCASPSFAADQAMRLACGLTDWIEGRWCPTEAELEAFVVNKTFNILTTLDDCGIDLGADDLLKKTWAAMLRASGNPADTNLAKEILSSTKTFDELACELHPVWSRELGRKA